jgi:hypothetical protein
MGEDKRGALRAKLRQNSKRNGDQAPCSAMPLMARVGVLVGTDL